MTSLARVEKAPAVRPVTMPLLDRVACGVVTGVPPLLLAIGMWFGWTGNLLDWRDLLILAVCYVVIGTGVTVGFHRPLTHRSFKTGPVLRGFFAALGSAAAD
jgi:stearoyl-CoA desaturase (Delta-9 desaturase)